MSKVTVRNYRAEEFRQLFQALLMAYGFVTKNNNGWLSLYCFNDDGEAVAFILNYENFSCKFEKLG